MEIGNSNIHNLFIATSGNKAIIVTSSLIDFVEKMKKLEPNVKNRQYYSKHFENNKFYYFQNSVSGQQYVFQKIENTKE